MPVVKDIYGVGFDVRIYALVVFPARYDLELHHWADAANLSVPDGADAADSSVVYWARAIGSARSGNTAETRQSIAELAAIHKASVGKTKGYASVVDQDQKEAQAWLDHAEGRNEQALKSLRALAEKEEAEGDEPLAIPAREMLADMLLDMNHPQEALTEYEADLKFNPNRFDGLYGAAHAAELAGKGDEANSYYTELLQVCSGSKSDRPELSHAKQLVAQK